QAGDVELNESVFGIEPNTHVLNEAVLKQRASLRQGTHAVKNRSAVRGGGRKPWKQKGTGQARQGSIRAPQGVGCGVVFGQRPRSYSYKMPKKVRRLPLKSALSSNVQETNLILLEDISFDVPKTKDFIKMLDALAADTKTLVVTAKTEENVARSANNLSSVKVITVGEINVLDLLMIDNLFHTKEAAEIAGEVLA